MALLWALIYYCVPHIAAVVVVLTCDPEKAVAEKALGVARFVKHALFCEEHGLVTYWLPCIFISPLVVIVMVLEIYAVLIYKYLKAKVVACCRPKRPPPPRGLFGLKWFLETAKTQNLNRPLPLAARDDKLTEIRRFFGASLMASSDTYDPYGEDYFIRALVRSGSMIRPFADEPAYYVDSDSDSE